MKKLVIALSLALVLGIAGTAFAAANPFVDVPAKHWAYESVAKLAKAGIIDGYGDGTFRGDKTLTRYEMAVIVAKAMANQEKADAVQKAEIAKLETEFSDELSKLGVRVTALENKVGNIKFTGEVRERYEYMKNPSVSTNNPALLTRFRLTMNAQLTDDLAFVGRYHSENYAGAAAQVRIDQAYLTGKAFDGVNFSLGRMPLSLGKGLTADTWHDWDGVKFNFGNQVKFSVGSAKAPNLVWGGPASNYQFGDIRYAITPNLDITAAYFKDKDSEDYKTWAAGLGYKLDKFTFTSEYGKNSSKNARTYNGNKDAKAWYGMVKYLGADSAKEKSYGISVIYRRADSRFDHDSWNTFLGTWESMSYQTLDNTKGFEYDVDYTVFKNGVLSFQYYDLKDMAGSTVDRRGFATSLTYSF